MAKFGTILPTHPRTDASPGAETYDFIDANSERHAPAPDAGPTVLDADGNCVDGFRDAGRRCIAASTRLVAERSANCRWTYLPSVQAEDDPHRHSG
jgi:hypothetical protein